MENVIVKLISSENKVKIEIGNKSIGGHQKGSLSYRTSGDSVTIMNLYNTAVQYTHYAMFICDGVSIESMNDLIAWMDSNFFRDASAGGSGGGGLDELACDITVVKNNAFLLTAVFDNGTGTTNRKHGIIVGTFKNTTINRDFGRANILTIIIDAGSLPAIDPLTEKYYASIMVKFTNVASGLDTKTRLIERIDMNNLTIDCIMVNTSTIDLTLIGNFIISYDINIFKGAKI